MIFYMACLWWKQVVIKCPWSWGQWYDLKITPSLFLKCKVMCSFGECLLHFIFTLQVVLYSFPHNTELCLYVPLSLRIKTNCSIFLLSFFKEVPLIFLSFKVCSGYRYLLHWNEKLRYSYPVFPQMFSRPCACKLA